MDYYQILISIVTSGTVSGLISFLFQTYFKARVEQRHRLEIEELKRKHDNTMAHLGHQLKIREIEEGKVLERKYIAYPRIIEITYRLKKVFERICEHGLSAGGFPMIHELKGLNEILVNLLYGNISDLRRDNVFFELHRFKNTSINIGFKVSDIDQFFTLREFGHMKEAQEELLDLCQGACASCTSLIDKLVEAEYSRTDC